MNFNRVILGGRVTKDLELRFTPAGKAVTTIAIAVNKKRGEKKTALYMDCIAWERSAEVCAEHLKKGSSVLIEGELQTRSWDKDGVKHHKTEVVAHNVQFVGGKREGSAQSPDNDDLPF